jgi:hypothetical protein
MGVARLQFAAMSGPGTEIVIKAKAAFLRRIQTHFLEVATRFTTHLLLFVGAATRGWTYDNYPVVDIRMPNKDRSGIRHPCRRRALCLQRPRGVHGQVMISMLRAALRGGLHELGSWLR